MHQKPSGGRTRPHPLGSLSAPPDPLAVLGSWGPQEGRGREGMGGRERKEEWKGRSAWEGKGRGGEREGGRKWSRKGREGKGT